MGYCTRSLPIDQSNRHQTDFLAAYRRFTPVRLQYANIQDRQVRECMANIQRQSEYLIRGMNYILRVNIIANNDRNVAYDYYTKIIDSVQQAINGNFAEETVEQLRATLNDPSQIQLRTFYNKNARNKGVMLLLFCAILIATMLKLAFLMCALLPTASATISAVILLGIFLTGIGGQICWAHGLSKIFNCFEPPLGSCLMEAIDKRQELLSFPFPHAEPPRSGYCGILSACLQSFFYRTSHPAAIFANPTAQENQQTLRPE